MNVKACPLWPISLLQLIYQSPSPLWAALCRKAGAMCNTWGYRAEIEQIYQAADFTVLASTYEPFGLVGIESVLCGTPALLADGIGCAEVLDAQAQINFAATDAQGLAHAVTQAVTRMQSGNARLADPATHINYATGTQAHAQALLDAWRAVA